MRRERLYLFDTTLRDGAQTNGVDFTLHDKQIIATMLDDLGIDYIEGGYPGANPADTEFFSAKPKFGHAKFTAFGMTRRAGRLGIERSWTWCADRSQGRCNLLRCEVVGISGAGGA
jgi:2-isopropylmalate synthase